MLNDDLRCMWAIVEKDLRAYYFKPPNISWGILFPFAFVLAFVIRDGAMLDLDKLGDLMPGLLALTLLFGTSSMEAIVITFERRIGALERLLLAPLRLPALLAGKLLGGMVFGLATTVVVLIVMLAILGTTSVNWWLLLVMLILSAAAFSALGVLISVTVKEVFEAQTLANAFRFPMMFLGGVFVPVASLPLWLRVVARMLPLTYAVEALHIAVAGADVFPALLDMLVLAAFTVVFLGFAVRVLARRVA
jgi:ABC-2 type transport system permease protein